MKSCHHCSKNIENNKPHFYIGYWKSPTFSHVQHYHAECFEEIAGKEIISVDAFKDQGLTYHIINEDSSVDYFMVDKEGNIQHCGTTVPQDYRYQWRNGTFDDPSVFGKGNIFMDNSHENKASNKK